MNIAQRVERMHTLHGEKSNIKQGPSTGNGNAAKIKPWKSLVHRISMKRAMFCSLRMMLWGIPHDLPISLVIISTHSMSASHKCSLLWYGFPCQFLIGMLQLHNDTRYKRGLNILYGQPYLQFIAVTTNSQD